VKLSGPDRPAVAQRAAGHVLGQTAGVAPASEDLHAPFTADVVRAINAFHASGADGALTCPGIRHDDDPSHPRTLLFATSAALVCPDPDCGYRQLWAPGYLVDAVANANRTQTPQAVADELPRR